MEFTNEFLPLLERLNEALSKADTVLIGAGAGLSTSAGFTYSGERFEKYFSDFRAKYGFTDMYTGGFYPFKTLYRRAETGLRKSAQAGGREKLFCADDERRPSISKKQFR